MASFHATFLWKIAASLLSMGRMPAVIRYHVVYSVLAGVLPQFTQGCALSTSTRDAFISSIRAGNAEYEKANLGGELLGVRDA